MDKALDGLWIIDAQAKTVYASDHMAEILGTVPSTMKGEKSFEYVFPEDTDAAMRLFDFKKVVIGRRSTSGCGEKTEARSGLMSKGRQCTTQAASSPALLAPSRFPQTNLQNRETHAQRKTEDVWNLIRAVPGLGHPSSA